MPAKRKAEDVDVNDIIESVNLENGWLDGLMSLDRDDLATVLADIANKAKVSTIAFKKARTDLPSFSVVKWSHFSAKIGLPDDPDKLPTEIFKTAVYRLPPSLHAAIFEYSWRWLDVYQEKVDQKRREARVRILDPVCQ